MNFLAYIDPGSGAMLWQIIAAAMIGLLYTVKKFWGSVTRVFKKHESSRK